MYNNIEIPNDIILTENEISGSKKFILRFDFA